jgi:ferredoxin-thioredoxin reductase catalytic subunit
MMDSAGLLRWLKQYAESQGFELNPDTQLVNKLVDGLLANRAKFGELYCPCRVRTGDEARDAKLICPCAYHLDEIREKGKCYCGLFVAKGSKG